jgi:hypothetical protein
MMSPSSPPSSPRWGHLLDDDPRLETLLRGSLGAAPQIDGLAFVRADLSSVRMRREENDRIDSISGSIAKKSYALELMEAAKRIKPSVDKPPLQWNPVLYVPELGVSFLSVMAPVRRDGKFAGVVLATVPVGELSRLIESSNPQSTMFILNASDGVVAHPFLTHGGFKPTVAHSELQRTELPTRCCRPCGRRRRAASSSGQVQRQPSLDPPRQRRGSKLLCVAGPDAAFQRPTLDLRHLFPRHRGERGL